MSSRILGMALFLGLGCLFATNAQAVTHAPQLIKPAATFTQDGVVEEDIMAGLGTLETNRVEKGALNGFAYRFFYSDGSGIFSGTKGKTLVVGAPMENDWIVFNCEKHKTADVKACYIQRNGLWIMVLGDDRALIVLDPRLHPGATPSVKVDENEEIVFQSADGRLNAVESEKLFKQLQGGKIAAVRHMQSPTISKRNEFSLDGFNEVVSYVRWALKNIE